MMDYLLDPTFYAFMGASALVVLPIIAASVYALGRITMPLFVLRHLACNFRELEARCTSVKVGGTE